MEINNYENKFEHGNIRLFQMDNMEFMKQIPDNYYELAIVDPPYGINIAKNGSIGNSKFKPKDWDCEIPQNSYFTELIRISINQIVWGGNYFPFLWVNGCKDFICWNKLNHHDNRADIEMAWTSFSGLAKYYEYMWDGNRYGIKGNIQGVGKKTIRIHPTQKPVQLYKWILDKYAKEGDRILDTHGGSMSIALACHDYKFSLDLCELDEDYFKAGVKRFQNHIKQLTLF